MRSNASSHDDSPVAEVSWDQARGFCQWLSRASGPVVRLPTEIEWEFACRAGSSAEYCFGDDEKGLAKHAWYRENSGGHAHRVAGRAPNRWGLHDLHGNVWEWCDDTWRDSHSERPPVDAQTMDGTTRRRVLKGGGWFGPASDSRSAIRDYVSGTECSDHALDFQRPAENSAISPARNASIGIIRDHGARPADTA